jgi:ABC-type oligopeptide transport system substrate-binding subunit
MQLAAFSAARGNQMSRPKFLTLLGLLVLAGSLSGCASFWHDLKPHRLHRINRGDPPSLDPEFSATPSSTEKVRFWT